jgi:hypothetical protein
MSADLSVSMDELERESAELLPSRETLCVYGHSHGGNSYTSYSFTQVASNQQVGLINVNLLGGDIFNL